MRWFRDVKTGQVQAFDEPYASYLAAQRFDNSPHPDVRVPLFEEITPEAAPGGSPPVVFTAQFGVQEPLPLTGPYGDTADGDRIFTTQPGDTPECGLWIVNTTGPWERAPEMPEGFVLPEGALFVVGGKDGESPFYGQIFINNRDSNNDAGTADQVIGTDYFRLNGFGQLDFLTISGTGAEEPHDQLDFFVGRQGASILMQAIGGVMIWQSVPDPLTGYIWVVKRGNQEVWGLKPGGHEYAVAIGEPDDDQLNPGDVVNWFDATDGAASFNRKAKTLDGTIVRSSSPLT